MRKDVEASMEPAARQRRRLRWPVSRRHPSQPLSNGGRAVTPTKLRQIIARRMAESKSNVPHFYVTHEYKMDALMELRKQVNAYLPDDQKISVNDFIVQGSGD